MASSAPDEPMDRKSITSDHSTVPRKDKLLEQQLYGCLGLFIPHPLGHLGLLECVRVHTRPRDVADHPHLCMLLSSHLAKLTCSANFVHFVLLLSMKYV
jgi:hypothetical protein